MDALRALVIAAAVFALTAVFAPAAQATPVSNVVPNPGFEQGGCGTTTVICGWTSSGAWMARDVSNPDDASMSLWCGPFGCYGSWGWAGVGASTDSASCVAISPGIHFASVDFWGSWGWASFGATFFQEPDCTGAASADSFGAWTDDETLTGNLVAPLGTQSALFWLGLSVPCDDFCSIEANFDDVEVEGTIAPDTTPPQTTITSAPDGGASTSATLEFTASEQSTFECSLDDGPFVACESPAAYSGLADGSHTFAVRATDRAGNTDPTPAEHTWVVAALGDFSIAASPDSHSILQGTAGTATIQTTVTSGSPQAVALAASVQPAGAGVGVWFSPSSIQAGERAMMVVNVGVATPPGTYAITVTGFGESWTRTTTVSVTVTCCGSDFSIAAQPSTLTLTPGASGAFAVETTLTSGTPQTVLLSATIASGVASAISYVPGSITMGGSATITVTVAASAPPGTYPMTIRGTTTTGSAMHDTTVDVIVQPAPVPDFSIAASPSSLGVAQGASSTSTISTAVTSGSTQTVSLSASGQPAGTTVDFTPASPAAGAASTMTIRIGSETVPGNYTISITGTGTTAVHVTTVALAVNANAPPTAGFTFSCSGLSCSFDGDDSADSGGAIVGYDWSFGDGTSSSGRDATHTYAGGGSYTVTLTVTDNGGALGSRSKLVSPITLVARGDKKNGLQRVDLTWNGPDGAMFDVYRNGVRIASVQAYAYTDTITKRGPGSYAYRVCAPATAGCSEEARVSF